MKHTITLISALLFAPLAALCAADTPVPPVKADIFEVEGNRAFVYASPRPAKGKPWIWYAPTINSVLIVDKKWYFDAFMNAGLAVAGFDLGEVRGAPASTAKFTLFYDAMVKRGYSPKPILLGQSRGGMMTLAWAFRHPDKVQAWVGIYPVCNLSSWSLKNSKPETLADFAMTEENLIAKLSEFNPINNLAGLAERKVPMFAVHGDNDVIVPYNDNTKLLKEQYEAAGGTCSVKIIANEGHAEIPAFFQCQELLDFVLKHAAPDARFAGGRVVGMEAGLEEGFQRPPIECGPWVYWRWKGEDTHLITKPCITDDLEAMRQQGMGGVVLDTIGGGQKTNAALYMSKEWLELITHAHREANRLKLGFYIHNCDGWATSGGPWITPENAMKRHTFSKTAVKGPTVFDAKLPQPDAALQAKHPDAGPNEKVIQEFYRDVAVLAYDRSKPTTVPDGVVNLTKKMSADGNLKWDVPAGDWTILRFGWAITGSKNAVASPSGSGLECDKLGARGIDAHLEGIAPILDILADTPEGNKSLIGVDSWEAGGHSWTQSLPEEFKAAKGYDMLPWLPVLAGDHLSSQTHRFRQDFNDLIQEMVRKNFMGRLTEKMHQRGILTQCESVPECADIPCAEYWAESPSERIHGPKADFFETDPRRSIAATSSIGIGPVGRGWGKNVMAAESFTSRCQNWERTPYALKSGLDWSFCSGINKTVFHLYAIQPDTQRKPHYMEHGTAVNRNLTWWNQAHTWFDYIARSQFMLRRGTHVSDICFIGDQEPWLKDGKIPKDFPVACRFDLAPWQRLVHDMTVKNGEAVFPEGAAYRLVVLPDRGDMRPDEIRKVKELLEAGAVVLARKKPLATRGLAGFPEADEQVRMSADTLWGANPPAQGERLIGKGRLLWGYTPEEALRLINWTPDFKCTLEKPNPAGVDWVHRRDGATDIYFVVNRASEPVHLDASFRVAGKRPELWDPDSTEIKLAESYTVKEGQTFVSFRLEPYESVFVVFREPGTPNTVVAKGSKAQKTLEIGGAWDLRFIDGMGAPETIRFESLVSWISRPEREIKYYSGRVIYTKTITVPEALLAAGMPMLDLGEVCDLVDVKVNGTLVRTLWKPPYRVSLKGVLKPGENQLEITVANTWLNRFIGDYILHGVSGGQKPENGPRYTFPGQATQDYNENTPLLASGLMGPVLLQFEDSNPFDGIFATDIAVQRPRFLDLIARGESQKIVTYGTSLTASGAWQQLLETQLNRRYSDRVSFINRGIGASCSADGIPGWNLQGKNGLHEERLSEMLSLKADSYFVEFAINDAISPYQISVEQSKANHEKIFSRIESTASGDGKKPEIILLKLSEPALKSREEVWNKGVDAYYAAYPEFAVKHGYLYFDASPPAMKLLAKSQETYEKLYPDGLHFSKYGAALIAETLLLAWGEKPLDDDLAYHRIKN